jgi:hypothetical protein
MGTLVAAALHLCFCAAPAQEAAAAATQARPAAEIVREWEEVSYPSMSEGSDPESIARFTKQIEEAAAKQEALALELLRSNPRHARVPELMTRRWTLLCTVSHDGRRVLEETGPYVGSPDATSPRRARNAKAAASGELRTAAAAARARAALECDLSFAEQRALIEQALAAAPGEESPGFCLTELLKYRTADPAVQRELLERFEKELADREWAGDAIRKLRGLVDRIGREVTIEFPDSGERGVGGLPRSTDELRGKPLLLHFASVPGADTFLDDAKAIARLRENFGARGLSIVSIHELVNGDSVAELQARLAESGYAGPQYVDPEPFGRNLMARSFAQSEMGLLALLDEEGRLQAFCFRIAPLEPLLERLLRPSGPSAPPAKPPRKRAI